MAQIHKTAIIGENVKLGKDVEIGPYAVIEDGVEIGDSCNIEAHARLCGGTILAANCTIGGFTTIAGLPQDLGFNKAVKSFVQIGENTVVREGSTVHRATVENSATVIGKNCFLMANSHIAHDCKLGDRVITAPFVALGGFVEVGDDSFISGGAVVHQKLRVGCGVMISGNSAISMEVPPFVNAFRRNDMAGLNIIGLARRKTPRASIANLKEVYSFVYANGGNPRKNAEKAKADGLVKTPEAEVFVNFFIEGRHYLRPSSLNDNSGAGL